MESLQLDALPDLPQRGRLDPLLMALWDDPQVQALWIGGSLARGAGDPFSDVDLRVAIPPADFQANRLPVPLDRFRAGAVGEHAFAFGDDACLFHLMLDNGEIYDLFVQTTSRPPTDEARLVLGCRDPQLAAALEGGHDPTVHDAPAQPEPIRQTVVDFWISQQKHVKVLARDLPLVAWEGQQHMTRDLLRLWYVWVTGNDCGPLQGMTIHRLSPVARAVQGLVGAEALAAVGAASADQGTLIAAAGALRDEVAWVGRELAASLGFPYPAAAEAVVRQSWARFLEGEGDGATGQSASARR